jgi:hypothetical protein
MADLWAEWNDDFQASATGDLLLADDDDMARQRITRRILTAVNGYIFHLEYGAGLPQRIGAPARQTQILAIVRSQIALETSVRQNPAPTVDVTVDANNPGLFTVKIQYVSAKTGTTISFSVSQ